jgi:hypothetical protein
MGQWSKPGSKPGYNAVIYSTRQFLWLFHYVFCLVRDLGQVHALCSTVCHSFFFFFCPFGGTGDWAQSLVLYLLNHTSSPFAF